MTTIETNKNCKCSSDAYMINRESLIKEDRNFAIGANIELNEKEQAANEYLMKYKYEELDKGFAKSEDFFAAHHFFKAKAQIDKSKVFQIITAMPKGASLHSHDTATVSGEYLYQLTFKENLYACIVDGELSLQFMEKVPENSNWKLLSQYRTDDPNFETFLKSQITLVCEQPEITYPDVNSVWKKFQNLFINMEKLITYKPIFQEYFYEFLKENYEENVNYVEFRGYLPTVYDLDGTTYSQVEVVGIYDEICKKFKEDYSKFIGCKFIFAPHRLVEDAVMDSYIKIYKDIKAKYPDFVLGFDLVGQEDLGQPLIKFLPKLLELKKTGCKFFFHAGETLWNGQQTDVNIIDAVLLDSIRVGHGFGLLKHPAAAKIVKEKGIAIEVCPISNQVLKLIDDLRNHPAAILIANNYPVVIGGDDPSFWGAKGISYDWYVTFMAISHRNADLRLLKQLALNSLEYSGLEGMDKETAKQQWESDWCTFIDNIGQYCKCLG